MQIQITLPMQIPHNHCKVTVRLQGAMKKDCNFNVINYAALMSSPKMCP